MNMLVKLILIVVGGLAVLIAVGWAGLQVSPANLPAPEDDEPDSTGVVEVPENLPAPVGRYLATALGEQAPHMDSLLVRGRARANFGLWMPLRYRLVHRPGYDFERYMEITWFGLPVLKALDRYLDGAGMTGPMGKMATGPETDQGANMILWAEAPLMPALFVTDPRIRWEVIDDTSARLIFPFNEAEDELTVYFDPESGLITRMTALRYRTAETGKVPWHVDYLTWQTVDGIRIPLRVAVTWEDQGKPWSYWDFEHVSWNVGISQWLPATVATER